MKWLCTTLLLVGAGVDSPLGDRAIPRLQTLQEHLRLARSSKDWSAALSSAEELRIFLNDNPQSILEVARTRIHTGDIEGAVGDIGQFVRMGQVSDFLKRSPEFEPLRVRPEFETLRAAMVANNEAISGSSESFAFHDRELLPEDIDYDSQAHRFLVTSVRTDRIVSLGPKGVESEFARAPDGWPMMAIKVDVARQRVWATEVALNGFDAVPQAERGRSALLCYDLRTGRLLRRLEGPKGSALGELSLIAKGDVLVSDGELGGVYRLRLNGAQLERVDRGDFISPQTPAPLPDGRHVFVPDYERGIALLDLATGEVKWLRGGGRYALSGVDGLYFYQGSLIAVQNGTVPQRVVVFGLDGRLSAIVSEKVVERSTSALGGPTHGVIVDGHFRYIADAGWERVDGRGTVVAGSEQPSPRLMDWRIAGS